MSFSQAGQDVFVLSFLKEKYSGVFIDIGSGPPVNNNNTYLLESKYAWTGLLIDSDVSCQTQSLRQRKSPFILTDATKVDYRNLFEEYNIPNEIDYLSLDIDPPNNTLSVLKKLPFDTHKFKCITFEHDSYWFGDMVKKEAKEILTKFGYSLLKEDVTHDGIHPFEDWYIHE